MQYAAGPSMQTMPFVLNGTTQCTIEGETCTLTSSVELPNGKERVVRMRGRAGNAMNGTAMRLEPLPGCGGPIYMIVSEQPSSRRLAAGGGAAPDSVLLREVNRSTDRAVMAVSLTLLGPNQLQQIGHELSADGSHLGVQLWHMTRGAEA